MRLEARDGFSCAKGGINLWKCRHCRDPPCADACPFGAIYEVVDGVYAIDEEKCNACGLCADACPYGAIEIAGKRAIKCDLCVFRGYPYCVETGGAVIVYTPEETDRIGSAFGWFVHRDGEYVVDIPQPGLSDAWLFREMVDRYEKLRGRYSFAEVLDGIEYEIGEIPGNIKKRVLWFAELTFSREGVLSFFDSDIIEEITVNRLKDRVYVYIQGEGWKRTNLSIWTEEYFLHLVNTFASQISRRITFKNPRLSAVLPDGSRLHAVIPPVAASGHSLTVRRFARRVFTPYDLILNRTATRTQLALIWLALERELNILIAGNTGSGKTTTLNAISAFIPPDERIIIVEETPEVRLPHKHVVRLVPTEEISMHSLVWDTLRMRPDRVFVGEVRKAEEVRALFDTMLAGQGKGSYATMHGRTSEELTRRILSMGVPQEDLCCLDLVVIQRRESVGRVEKRRIVEMKWNRDFIEAFGENFDREVRNRAKFLSAIKEKNIETYCKKVMAWY